MRKLMCVLTLMVVAVLGTTGCANPNYTVINPHTNQVNYCAASGWGWLGAPLAALSAGNCVREHEQRGFIKVTTPATLEITTDPAHATIYASPDPGGLLTEMGIAPINKTMRMGSYWKPECYKAVYDGRESEVVCKEHVEVNRRVHLIVKAQQTEKQ